jgi:2-polyprenyl-3-methyl-5-hydroxy-6-metoxy-1,4-benzoquinol methylase
VKNNIDRSVEIFSPIDGVSQTTLLKKLKSEVIISAYHRNFQIDVSRYFNGHPFISLFECKSTGYRFFHPYDLSGDDFFYQQLSQIDWYYMPIKWEHTKFLELGITGKILEVGCGNGGFLRQLNGTGAEVVGLEMNTLAVETLKKEGLAVLNQDVGQFSKTNGEQYDIVCSFQVLEHVANVNHFVQGQIDCLKKGGYLVCSVPNNDSFIKYDSTDVLNCPPHHMGRWTADSLANLQKIFPITIENVYYEPLQQYHVNWFSRTFLKKVLGSRVYYKFVHKSLFDASINKIINFYRHSLRGHSVMIVYKKQ